MSKNNDANKSTQNSSAISAKKRFTGAFILELAKIEGVEPLLSIHLGNLNQTNAKVGKLLFVLLHDDLPYLMHMQHADEVNKLLEREINNDNGEKSRRKSLPAVESRNNSNGSVKSKSSGNSIGNRFCFNVVDADLSEIIQLQLLVPV